MTVKTHSEWIPLARMAHQHGWTWSRAYNLALSGKVEAKQTETGRWLVRSDSLPADETGGGQSA
jgi:hypothetical protein